MGKVPETELLYLRNIRQEYQVTWKICSKSMKDSEWMLKDQTFDLSKHQRQTICIGREEVQHCWSNIRWSNPDRYDNQQYGFDVTWQPISESCICINRHSSVRLLSYQLGSINWAYVMHNDHIHNDQASKFFRSHQGYLVKNCINQVFLDLASSNFCLFPKLKSPLKYNGLGECSKAPNGNPERGLYSGLKRKSDIEMSI